MLKLVSYFAWLLISNKCFLFNHLLEASNNVLPEITFNKNFYIYLYGALVAKRLTCGVSHREIPFDFRKEGKVIRWSRSI